MDLDRLLRVASAHDLVIRMDGRIGSFIPAAGSLVVASPYGRVSDAVADELVDAFSFGPERTPRYDIEFSLRRIVEIAQRALSPGINDPTTALYCLDRLGEVLGLLADRRMPSGRIMDHDMELRVVSEPVNFADLACSAYAAVARYGISDDDLVARLLYVMEKCSRSAPALDREKIMRLHDTISLKSAGLGSKSASTPTRSAKV